MDESPGWAAIAGALERIYGDTEPMHWGTIVRWRLGGPDPLDGVSAYTRDEPVPHWHYVSFGLSELYEKESENLDDSGWGFELTFRLVRAPDDEGPPLWAVGLLQNLARYVFNTGNWFDAGHHMNVNGPIAADREDSAIRAIAFVLDPELGQIATPHGAVRFLQVVGLTLDELDACQQWRTESLLPLLEPRTPLFTTDIDRGSLLADPATAAAVREGVERDGSSVGWLAVDTAHWTRADGAVTLRLGALQAPSIAEMLRLRIPFDRYFELRTEDTTVSFEPAPAWEVEEPEPGVLRLGVPESGLAELLAALTPHAGRTAIPSAPALTVEIVPTRIRDAHGNETGRVVG